MRGAVPTSSEPLTAQALVLVVDTDPATGACATQLDSRYRTHVTRDAQYALEYLRRGPADVVVADLGLPEGLAIELCRGAKGLTNPATVLVTSVDPTLVPEALRAGCDGVLLKPFGVSLFATRLGRLLRDRSVQLRIRSARSLGKVANLTDRSNFVLNGTNRTWADQECPYCAHREVVSFDFVSMRRAWYACVECNQVWIAKRRE